ncbi:spectrin beta chain, non-erythrocytic 1 isoform X2 [Copidosoma floridanum]|uniref:spectrin beta chain, non-erythrocytic 1 isoform X2 n=1 Tax=Copidosoma floridanum TaxID=29053 RepID=UPI0006C94D59|nr:spectrin beta chain, non-erythrocytic 1 isoform X2 [Copidosoma floridanum]
MYRGAQYEPGAGPRRPRSTQGLPGGPASFTYQQHQLYHYFTGSGGASPSSSSTSRLELYHANKSTDRGDPYSRVHRRMTQREDALKFEQSRIKSLQEERLLIQKKTFTKWINSFLLKARMELEDLFTDLADGKKLLKLLEIISGERLAKPNNGRMRVHKIENVNKSLAFLHTKVRLESIGAEDIVDGNPRLILGLIWTIILRFQIQEIEIDVDEENESSEKKSAKDALLLWCQRKTNGYPGVNIQDFTVSWRSGLGFNALIHSHRPDLINWSDLQQTRHIDNLNYAFDVANSELGIPRLLDAEDVDTARPDEKSIMTYVASYYHTFARMKNEIKSGKRIANIVGQMMDADKMKVHYGKLTAELLEWIKLKMIELEDRNFPNSLEGIQRELLAFKQYRTIEKPPKYKERSEIEALYFHINTRLKSLNQPAFVPQEGQLVNDIERKWIELERAEHRREVALRSELLRQERLEQLNYKFERKSVLREGYLKEMIQVLSDPRYGSNLAQVDATVKKHEAISADILAREERFHDLTNMSEELVRENYHGLERVRTREQQVLQRWRELLGLLDRHKANLSALCALMSLMREIETTLASVQELQLSFQSTEVGPHLLGVEDLLQRHSLQELQVTALGESQRRLVRQAAQVQTQVAAQAQQPATAQAQGAPVISKEAALLEAKLEQLNKAYGQLGEYSKERKARLEDARNFFQFLQDHEDEESWLVDRQRICRAGILAKDLRALISLQQKHKALEDETKTRKPKSEQLSQAGKRLVQEQHPSASEIENRLESLQEHWRVLEELLALRKKQLEEASEALQFCADANEADSWMKEKMALVASEDYGVDEPSAQALLQRHKDLEGELNAYQGDLQSLNTQADRLQRAGVSALHLDQAQTGENDQAEPLAELEQDEWTQEVRLVPQDEWVEEVVERNEPRVVLEDRLVPQVRSLYPFSGQGMAMGKGEIMLLLNKTNPDWWSVRKADGSDGFVPATYVREIEPKVIQVQVRKLERVQAKQRVKKTRMVRKVVPIRRTKSIRSAVKPAHRKPAANDADNLEKRMKMINDTYARLQELAKSRHALLEDAIRLYGFYRECDDFEKWIKDREKMLKADDSRDNVEAAKRKYEKFLTDLSASGKRVEAIDAAVNDFVKQGHSQLDKVRARQRHIHQLWDHLNWLKAQKEKSLEGASSVELFNRTCDEAHDWMLEKITQLDTAEIGPDLKTVQALQRRHQHLERELAPVEEKVRKVNLLANSVKNTYPNELNNVNARQNEVRDIWNKVQNKALERRSRLEDAVGQQIFMNSSKNLINWATEAHEIMKAEEPVRDIATAERLKKQHVELGEEVKTKEDEFREVEALGSQLLLRNPSLSEVKERHDKLRGLYDSVKSIWQAKQAWLGQCLELQQFNREADQIDATTSSHAAFLEFGDLGESLDDVEALLKQHEKFENTLSAQDDRLKIFSEVAEKLIAQNHYDKNNIYEKRNQVLARRAAVKETAQRRRAALKASEYYQQFSAEVDDLKDWLSDKMKTASDETYRDLNNLERKLQKHEAFERELRANEGQLRTVNKAGKALISEENYRAEDVGKILKDLNEQWDQLVVRSLEKGRRLRQAAAQHGYNRVIEDARLDLGEIENAMASKQVGKDLRSCKDLLKKHQLLETKLMQWEQKVNDLVTMGQEMVHEGHFDAPNILKTSQATQKKFQSLKEPAKKRLEALEESLRFHKFGFELDAELQWINDHLPQASSAMMGQNLHQAQSLHKKHKKFEAEIMGHEPMIMKTLASGQNLIDQVHPERNKIQELCDNLNDAWQNLQEKATERSHALDLSLKAQEFFFEAGEVESWLVEKNDVLSSTDYGRDRDAATKLLTKHKALELELDTYNGIVTEMGNTAATMINAKHPDSKSIANKQQAIAQQVRSLQRLAAQRQQRLMESMYRHEYFLESRELEQWIKEQEQTAASEDYGQDYEHLLLLQGKFNDFKHRIEAGSERFNQCQVLAKKLIANESPYIQDIEKRQEQLGKDEDDPVLEVAQLHASVCESWQHLLKLVRNREQRLQAAGEIHRFHRDVAEALSRIQEKKAALPDDLGRDLNSVLALIRRHEGFENDLVALEAQLQVLVEDSARLQALYPGNNAVHIDQQQKIVLANWEELKEQSAHRRDQLQASCDLQRFLTQVRDLMNWTAGLCATMSTQDNVRDAASAQNLKAEHEALKGEIEAREDTFSSVLDLGEAMVQTGHYAASEVEEKCSQLLDDRQKLHTAWQQKKIHLDQLIDLHFFLRDAKQLDNLSISQTAALNNDIGMSVEEIDAQIKKQKGLEKLLYTQEEKFTALREHGHKLLSQNHFESRTISKRLDEVFQKRARVWELAGHRRVRLEADLMHAQFVRDVAEAETWIGEKQKKLEAEATKGQVSSLEDKIKKLQKHQAFQAELAANQSRIEEIKVNSETLLTKKHPASGEIRQQLDNLLSSWNKLLIESENRGRGLEEAQDILDFNNQVEKIKAWIRDKEMMVQAGGTGKDYEHCLSLQRKLDDVDSDMRVDESRMESLNALADKLIKQGEDEETKTIQQRWDTLNNKWRGLQGDLGAYRETLAGALEIHLFNRDIDDTNQRVVEKSLAMNTNDAGKDLAGVEHLQRKQEAMERDMTAIEGKLKEHQTEAHKLSQKYPDNAAQISGMLSELETNWNELQRLTSERRENLGQAYELHKFRAELRELETWVAETTKRMSEAESPATILEAEALLELHQERKAEIDGRQDTFKALGDHGRKLIPVQGECMQESLHHLENLHLELNEAWHSGKRKLKQAHQLQLFKEQANQADSWLATKEAFLNNDDLGDSLSSVEKLMRKHEDFEKMLTSQLGRIEELEKFANVILSEDHADAESIKSRLTDVSSRRDKLKSSAASRRSRLLESRRLHQFLRNVVEVESWLHEKQQVASDESYRDSTNLQSKIQKHAAFESELAANKGRVSAVTSEGEALVKEDHFASKEIQERVNELDAEWELLQETSKLKKNRLDDAYQALLFNRTLDEFEAWMDEIETQLQSEDHGKDLSSVANLLKRHTNLENDVMSHNEACESMKETAANFQRAKHFMSEEIQERASAIINRYHGLQEPIQIRRDNLEDAKLLHQFARDVEDELHWLSEKEVLAGSKDLGSSLTTVQRLQKKHHALEAELISREPVVSSLASRATAMVRSGHFASEKIDALSRELQEKLIHLRDLASNRKLRLLDAVESQMFYAEAAEAEQWIKEKQPLLTSMDYGKDEDSVQSLFKKLEGVERDLCGFTSTIENLKKLSKGLIERHHFDSKNIAYKQSEIEHKFEDLQNLKEKRSQRLLESEKYHRFIQQADQVIEWIGDQTTIAASEDYGADVEHVELLIQMFDNFLSSLISSENRMTGIIDAGQKLIEEKNPESSKIHMKIDETKQQWEDLKELAHARQEALAGAKQVHMFDRTADETISWIQEKEATLGSDHEYAHDLETIQALVRKHQGLDTDLKAVKEQVDSVMEEASRLAGLFPDATEHIAVKHEQVDEAWSDLLEKAAQRKSKLVQAEQLQAYFDEYRDLISWINEMVAKITAPELARDVPGAEALISRHSEYRAEIDAHDDAFAKFYEAGQKLVQQGHFLAKEIQEKVSVLKQRSQTLEETWERRKLIYEQNLDTQTFKRDAETLENWLVSREPMLKDEQLGESIQQVEELIMKHQDFEKTVEAQEDKFNAIKRITMLERAFQKQLESEMAARQAEKERTERARLEERKRKEVQRITEERKREEERRRYVESPRHASRNEMNGTYDHDPSMDGSPSPVKSEASDSSQNTTPSKSYGGLHHMLSDRLRRTSAADIKRAESMKVDTKKPRRTPSFTTRRRTQSFRKHQRIENVDSLPPVEIQGVLERKHELQSGGKKAAVRSWKPYYTVLCGQLLCFFKDIDDFQSSKAATAPINIFNATCEKADDYTKRKNVFRLRCTDGSEFLFLSSNKQDMEDWVNKISFHAKLPPSLQLMSYDDSHKDGVHNLTPDHAEDTLSTGSSHASTPEMERKNSVIRRDMPTSPNKPPTDYSPQHQHHHQQSISKKRIEASRNSDMSRLPPDTQPQKEFLQMYMQQQQHHHHTVQKPVQQQSRQHDQFVQREQQYMTHPSDKPPIPPRGAPPPVPTRSPSFDGSVPIRRNEHYGQQSRPQSYQPPSGNVSVNGTSGQYNKNDGGWHHYQQQGIRTAKIVPPLPTTAPPSSNKNAHWNSAHDNAYGNIPVNTRQVSPQQHQMNTYANRPTSLPPYVPPPMASSPTTPANISVVDGSGRRASESGSESEHSFSGSRKDRDYKKSSVLSNLFGRRKKPSQQ